MRKILKAAAENQWKNNQILANVMVYYDIRYEKLKMISSVRKENNCTLKDNPKHSSDSRNQHKGKQTADAVVRKIWLNYFNDYLYQHNLITEEERQKLRRMIG